MYIRTESQPAIKRREKKTQKPKRQERQRVAERVWQNTTRCRAASGSCSYYVLFCPTHDNPPCGTTSRHPSSAEKTAVMMKNVCVHSLRVVERIRKRNPPHFLHTHAKGSDARRARLMATPT